MKKFYSNGKLLLTGEYLVLDEAKALAIPTKYGQDLLVYTIDEHLLAWESFDENSHCWFQAEFRLSDFRIVNETFDATSDDSFESIAQTLQNILITAKTLNPEFLNSKKGFHIKTNINFPRKWGLGTSSTLINNIAQWAEIDAFELLEQSFGGSGYDIACAQHNHSITFQRGENKPTINQVDFNPPFANQLYFVYLNIKQDSKKGIQRYKDFKGDIGESILQVNRITEDLISCTQLSDFEELIEEHENIISKIINTKPIQELVFPDYFGQIKSLGAWGGDFVLATGNNQSQDYFKQKGFETIIPFKDMVL